MDISQFLKRKSISDSRSVENISDKRLGIEVQPAQTNGKERVNPFFEHFHFSSTCRKHFRQKIRNWGSTSTD